jgi:LmbE family N-acetylglucosaminyl deacetylase
MRVLHVSPHPDDELLGAPALLLALADAGHQLANLTVSLGRRGDHTRRRAELHEASARAGLELRTCTPPLSIGRDDDLGAAQAQLTHQLVTDEEFDLLIAPSPHDGHHGHEVVARAAVAAASARGTPLWMWALWSELPVPTILHAFGPPMLERVARALSAYAGELQRNDYLRILAPRAEVIAVLGPERVFGFGAAGISARYAEVVCEAVPHAGAMLLGTPRTLDPAAPLAPPSTHDLTTWLHASSLRETLRR